MFGTSLIILAIIIAAGAFAVRKYAPAGSSEADSSEADSRNFLAVVGGIAALIAAILIALFCHAFVKNQHVGYVKVFGVVQPNKTLQPGFHVKVPWENIDEVSTAVGTMTFSGSRGEYPILEGLTQDQIVMHVDLAVTWNIVGENVPAFKRVFGVDGNYSSNVYSIIRSAVRDTIAQTRWKEGAILNRAAFAQHLKANIESKTTDFFKQAGMGAESNQMVEYAAVNLRQIIPPKKVQDANNDLAAADIQNQLQQSLLKVEQSRKAVREAQAANFAKLAQVPAGMSAADYATVLKVTTEQMNAETVRDALENNKPVTVVVGMGVAPTPTTNLR